MSLHTPHCTVICFFTFAFRNSMPPTNSSPDDIVCTTIILALTSLCAMSATYSFSQCLVSASFLATPLPLSPPMSVTKSSILGNIGTTFMTAMHHVLHRPLLSYLCLCIHRRSTTFSSVHLSTYTCIPYFVEGI